MSVRDDGPAMVLCDVCEKWTWPDAETHVCPLIPWALYQLANDVETYGADAGRCLITTEDGEDEVSGVMDQADAERLVAEHNAAITAGTAG